MGMGLRIRGGMQQSGRGPAHALKPRLAAAAALVGIVVLSGCASTVGSASTGSSPPRSSAPAASLSASSADQLCTASALLSRGGRQGESLGAHGDIWFTNTGQQPCVLRGIPRVRLLRADGSLLAVHRAHSPAPFNHTVILAPGKPHAAWLEVYWSNWCGPPPGPLRLEISLAHGRGTLTIPFDGPPDGEYVPVCVASGQPSTLAVVDAYVPGFEM
jgi:Domain of unknown function (DUF4232)